jgi:hypothetical protein
VIQSAPTISKTAILTVIIPQVALTAIMEEVAEMNIVHDNPTTTAVAPIAAAAAVVAATVQ